MVNAGTQNSSLSFTYDVFLSFRGEDTRFGFTKNLYDALVQHKINAFMDVVNLDKGEEIDDALLGAIDRSKMAIIVFSKHYASSSWCLGELAMIIESKDRGGMKVIIPVFYHIEPTIIRKQTDSYGEAMAAHEKRFKNDMEKVRQWRSALSRAANISGWDTINVYEVDLIRNIVDDVSKKLKVLSSKESRDTSQATSQGHLGKNGVRREERVSNIEKSDVSFDWSHMAATTAAKAPSKMDKRSSVSDEEKGTVNSNWKDVAGDVAAAASSKLGTGKIREEPPSCSSVMERYDSFECPFARTGSQSFEWRENENASSGKPQYGNALYDFIAGMDDELNVTAGEELEIEYEVDGWFYVKKKRAGRDGKRDGKMAGLVPVLYVKKIV